MNRFHPEKFLQIASRLDIIARTIPDDDVLLTNEERIAYANRGFAENMQYVLAVCDEAHLGGIKSQVNRVMLAFSPDPIRHRDLRKAVTALIERIYDALSELAFMQVPPGKSPYYDFPNLFGDDVAINFLSAIFDIEEAGKCFAVSRHTACVFHLMRVVEVGLMGFGQALGVGSQIKSAQPSWGEVLRLTKQEIQTCNKSTDPTWTREKQSFFENVQSDLSAVKNAWRNPTMHVENRYDEERAEDIFSSVKGFMRHLAKHLDEEGNFTP